MLFNTQSAVRSIEVIGGVLDCVAESRAPDSWVAIEAEDTLNHLQNIIGQGAALSRYFWPVRKGHERRGEHLRKAFGVTHENPLRSRDLRNAMEHFDEKLDQYLSTGVVGNILPQYFGPLITNDGVSNHVFRAYYTDVRQYELLGKRYEVEPIAEELLRLNEALMKCDRDGGRL